MNVLLIAPRTDLLYVEEEVQGILRSGLTVTPLLGNVTHADVLREVEKSYDVLWLCTHGNEEGVLLSDGVLNASLLVALVRDKFNLIVLNTCESFRVAQLVQNETSAEVVATVLSVPDKEAFQTGTIFARELAKTGDFERAYYAARPGSNRTYVRLAGKTMHNDANDSNVIKELQMAVFGNPKVNFLGMMTEITEIRKIVNDLATKMAALQDNGKEHSEVIVEIKNEVADLKRKIYQLDGTIGWKPNTMLVVIATIFGSVLMIGEIIRLIGYFF